MEGASESTSTSKDSIAIEPQPQNGTLKNCHDSGLFDWQSSKHELKERFEHIFNEQLFCDVHFIVGTEPETKKISAHRLVLTAASVVFQTMFSEKWSDDANVIEISDVEPAIFEELLKFIYSDKVSLTGETVTEIMYVAKKYAVRALELKCADFLEDKICVENAFTLLIQARFFDVAKLSTACLKVIGENTADALKTDDFCNIDAETLCLLLEQSNLRISEIDLFEAVVRWSKAACQKRNLPVNPQNQRSVLKNAISFMRFPLMFPEDFTTKVVDSGLLSEKEMLAVCLHYIKKSPSCDGFSKAHRSCVYVLNRYGSESQTQAVSIFEATPVVFSSSQSIAFSADSPIQLFGIGLYGSPGKSVTYNVTIIVSNNNISNQVLSLESGVYDGSTNIYKVMLKKPISLWAYVKYTIAVTIQGSCSLYGTEGKREVTMSLPPDQKVKFTFFDIDRSNILSCDPNDKGRKTCVSSGQIPEILFGLESHAQLLSIFRLPVLPLLPASPGPAQSQS